jgi:hypothetical protein
MTIWSAAVGEEFKALAKNQYRNIVSTFSTCSSTSDGMCYRSKVTRARKIFHTFNILYFLFLHKGWNV